MYTHVTYEHGITQRMCSSAVLRVLMCSVCTGTYVRAPIANILMIFSSQLYRWK